MLTVKMDHCNHRRQAKATSEFTAVSSRSRYWSSLRKISLYHVVIKSNPGPKAGRDGKGQSVAKVGTGGMRNELDPCLFTWFNLHSGWQQANHGEKKGDKRAPVKREKKNNSVYIHLEHNWESFKRVMNSLKTLFALFPIFQGNVSYILRN